MKLKFESYQGVFAYPTDNPLVLRLDGPAISLEGIKKQLTVQNKSVSWGISKLSKSLDSLKKRASEYVDPPEGLKTRIGMTVSELKKAYEELNTEYFEEVGGNLNVPAGFWFLAQNVEGDVHLNTDVPPYFVPGLRDYQKEAVETSMKYKRSTTVLFTGAGKSLVIASMCMAAVRAGKRACVVVPTEYLVRQVEETLKRYHNSVSAVGGGKTHKLGADLIVTTAQSAMKVIDLVDMIILDESQHCPANTWQEILTNTTATHVYNLTATAFRADGMDLAIHAFGGPTVFERNVKWGIQNGWLKDCSVVYQSLAPLDKKGNRISLNENMNAQRAYKTIVENQNVMEVIKGHLINALSKDRKIIVIFKTLGAGQMLKKVCGSDVEFECASATYKKPLDDFRNGKTRVLVATDRLVSEGVDIPDADVLILCTQHSSDVITFQAVGRVLRKSGDKKAVVIDICLTGFKQFENSINKRIKVYKQITDNIMSLKQ